MPHEQSDAIGYSDDRDQYGLYTNPAQCPWCGHRYIYTWEPARHFARHIREEIHAMRDANAGTVKAGEADSHVA